MVFRVYRRKPVIEGDWYFALNCKKCGKIIYAFDDSSAGARPPPNNRQEMMATACSRCFHEDSYSMGDLISVKSQESFPSTYPERQAISGSGRKPLAKSFPDARVTMGFGFIEDRPKAAALVGRIVTSWADVEIQVARLLAELMGANVPQVAAVFGSLRNSRSQSDALVAAAEVVLSDNDLLLFRAYIARKASLEKERNDLAHGCFGISLSIPDHVVWVAQSDYLNFISSDKSIQKEVDLRERQFVYEIGTLERIAAEIGEFFNQLGMLIGYLSARRDGPQKEDFRAQRYTEICAQPHIKQALAATRAKNAKGQA